MNEFNCFKYSGENALNLLWDSYGNAPRLEIYHDGLEYYAVPDGYRRNKLGDRRGWQIVDPSSSQDALSILVWEASIIDE